jgi:hypothetical protein
VVAAVPWARHDAGFTRSFEDTAAWLAVNTSKSAICQLLGIAWRTVGRICERVSAEAKTGRDLFANLTELGFDEISIRKGQCRLARPFPHNRRAMSAPIERLRPCVHARPGPRVAARRA